MKITTNAILETVVSEVSKATAFAMEMTLTARGYQARAYKPIGSKTWNVRTSAITVVVQHIADNL